MRSLQALAIFSLGLLGCSRSPIEAVPAFSPQPLGERPGVHNLIRLTDQLYSGSSPEAPAGFTSLAELGIRTVISVDGTSPDVEEARKQGLRYVHLPIGYDAVPYEIALEIAKALKELPGPIYIHCHHGKHRGPAAAAAAVRCLDPRCSAADAFKYLAMAGTDPHYAGLFRSVGGMAAASQEVLSKVTSDFPERSKVNDLAKSMVLIDICWDKIKEIRAAKWKAPAKHPDLDPANEALQLVEHYRELIRLPDTAKRPESFRKMLSIASGNAGELERYLRVSDTGPNRNEKLEAAFRASAESCTECHAEYRDGR